MLPNIRSKVPARQWADVMREQADRNAAAASSARKINHSTVTRPGGLRVVGDGSILSEAADGTGTRLADGGIEQRTDPDGPWEPYEAAPPTPVAPTSSPTPQVDGFAGLLLARWTGVLNETPVTYDVHVAESDASAPSSLTLVDSVMSTSDSIRTLADGERLDYDADYWVAIVARSEDQAAAPSPWAGPTRMDRTRSADIAADAIDGMTITGATLRTGSSGAREQISTADGYVSYDSAGNPQTTIKNGRLTTTDAVLSGALVGGSISIAQGVESTLTQDFGTATGTTPPTGWSRTVVTNTGTVSGGGVDFPTTGGNPTHYLRLRAAQVANGGGNVSRQVTRPASLLSRDYSVEFDFRRTGDNISTIASPHMLGVSLRAEAAGDTSAQAIPVNLTGGAITYPGGSAFLLEPLPVDTWYRMKLVLRGTTLTVEVRQGSTLLHANGVTLSAAARTGAVEFIAGTSGFLGASSAVASIDIDNVTIQALRTGLDVPPDGYGTVPDPLVPLGIVNKRTLEASVAAVTYVNNSGFPVPSGPEPGTNATGWTQSGDTNLMSWNNTTRLFTCLKTGTYLVSLSGSYNGTPAAAGTLYEYRVNVNGTRLIALFGQGDTSSRGMSVPIAMQAGDTIEANYRHSHTAAVALRASSFNTISFTRIGGAS